jgi:dTDP-4-amino-4,6-dideoxygalactose transaminase
MKIEVYSPTIRRKEMDAVLTAMVEDKIGPGDQAKFLIQTAREKIRFDYCLTLRSPAMALHLALRTLNLEKGQGVMVSALSPLYYARVIEDLGLKMYCCDVHPSTVNMSMETVEKALASKSADIDIRCIILQHTLGYLGDGVALAELGIPVIEDCSQSYGTVIGESPDIKPGEEAEPNGSTLSSSVSAGNVVPAGNAGVFAILGLEERDMLTSGGGALLYSANRRDSAVLRSHGDLPPEYGLPDMNAALAIVQFREAAKNLLKRREIARLYSQSALSTRHKRFIQPEVTDPRAAVIVNEESREKQPVEYNNYAFPLILETGMKDVKAYARRKDIAVESAFDNTLTGRGMVPPEQCPEAYSLSLRTVLFPIYPRIGMADAGKVAKLILTLP